MTQPVPYVLTAQGLQAAAGQRIAGGSRPPAAAIRGGRGGHPDPALGYARSLRGRLLDLSPDQLAWLATADPARTTLRAATRGSRHFPIPYTASTEDTN